MTTMSTTANDATLIAALRQLRATPPPELTERVLARIGLPRDTVAEDVDEFVVTDGPSGALFVAFNRHGINDVLAAELVDGDADRFVARHLHSFGRPARPAATSPAGLAAALRSGQTRKLDFDLRGLSHFEQAVLRKALDIPRGEVRPYGWVAREIGRPRAARAVGSALGRNPVPVLIPCHRVVLADGRIGEYVHGPSMKRSLLDAEGVDVAQTERLARTGVHLIGSDTTRIVCFPTCHHARRITDAHRVGFRSLGNAAGAGYRPCADCRPGELRSA